MRWELNENLMRWELNEMSLLIRRELNEMRT